MGTRMYTLAITTAADGSYTGYTPAIRGLVDTIQYVKTNFADTVDFTITSNDPTPRDIWLQSNVTASVVKAPRQPTHTTAGVASVYAATDGALTKIPVKSEIKVVLAQGGNATTGRLNFWVTD